MASRKIFLIAALLALSLAGLAAADEVVDDSPALEKLKAELKTKDSVVASLRKELKQAKAAQSDEDKLATKLKATEEKAKMYEKHIKATADKASALEKDAAESKEKVKEALAGKEAAEQKLKELEATHAHSKTASTEMSGRAELAESRLAEREKALSEVEAALKASQEAVRALDAEKAASLKEVEKLSTELSNLQKVNENFEKMQKELHAATEALKNRADKSEATLKAIEKSLEAAEASAASSQKALKAAEDKAENATARLEEILHKTRNNWLPLWLEEHYQKGSESVRPFATNALEHAGKLHVTVRSKAVEIWKALQAKLQALLKDAKPISQKYLVKLEASIRQLQLAVKKHAIPQLQKAAASTKAATQKLLSHPQVLQARRRIAKQVQELKGEIKKYMKSHKMTAKYAKEPFLTYALYAAIVLPLVLCLLPIYALSALLRGGKRRTVRRPPRRPSASSSPTSNVQGVKNAKAKSAVKGRRITMGGDSIRVPE
ncbi:probable Laminin-like protein epi-1 at N-terminal half [Coccomyxa sp. Obi]|nr:probable Laminin-like protein epi-1 at N-terminal half [Coccomyxa sp. Obi]